jgi:hypothetical protein
VQLPAIGLPELIIVAVISGMVYLAWKFLQSIKTGQRG